MTMLASLDDQQMDALLSGAAPLDELAPIAEVVQRLRHSAASEPVPPMSAALHAQLASAPVVALRAHRAARGSLVKAAAAAAAAAIALLGAGAAQNRLPNGLQDVVSSTADLIGIDVPRAADRSADEPDDGVGGDEGNEGTTVDQSDTGQGAGNDGEPGYEGTTPGGATPADPGTPGDKEPATPAVPPTDPGSGDVNASPNGQENGDGVTGGNGSTNADPNGQENGTGTAKSAG